MTLQQPVNGGDGEHHTRNHRHQRIWTDAAVAELLRLDGAGLSASKIVSRMGGGLTRSAVIGKLDRLTGGPDRRSRYEAPPRRQPPRRSHGKLPPKPRAAKPKSEKFQSRAGKNSGVITRMRNRGGTTSSKVAPTAQNWLASGPWAALPGTSPVSLMDLPRHSACRWPIGDRPMLFCGAASDGVYCEAHAALAYARASQ